MQQHCHNCGTPIKPGGTFCANCGAPVLPQQAAAPGGRNGQSKITIIIAILCAVVVIAVAAFFVINYVRGTDNEPKVSATGDEEDERSADYYIDLGYRYLREGDYDKAIKAFENAIDIDSKLTDAYVGLSEAYIAAEDYDKALEVLEKGYSKTKDRDLEDEIESVQVLIDEEQTEDSPKPLPSEVSPAISAAPTETPVATAPSSAPESASPSTSPDNTEPTKVYIIYSDNAFAPFEYFDTATNTYVGVDMDLLAAIAANQGFKYIIKNGGFDAAMGAVQSGQADAMIAGMTIRNERKEVFDFSVGYFTDGQVLVVPAGSEIASIDDLNGKKIAVKIGTAGAAYAQKISGQYGIELQLYEDSPTMYMGIISGMCDACFEDYSIVRWAIKNDGLKLATVGEIIDPVQYGFATKKGSNTELIKMFNTGLKSIRASGEYDNILAKYGY